MMDKPEKKIVVTYSAPTTGAAVPEPVVPIIVRTSLGVSNNVQRAYAQWQRGIKRSRG